MAASPRGGVGEFPSCIEIHALGCLFTLLGAFSIPQKLNCVWEGGVEFRYF